MEWEAPVRRPVRRGRAWPGVRHHVSWCRWSVSTKSAADRTLREVARVQPFVPDGFVHLAELGDGELGRAEGRCEGRVLELGARSFDAVSQDLAVVEREQLRGRIANPPPPGGRGIGASRGEGGSGTIARRATLTTRIRGSRSGAPYVASCSRWAPADTGLFWLSRRGLLQPLVDVDEPPGSASSPANGSSPAR